MSLWITVGGYAAAALLFWLWLGARDDLASQIEQCNASKLESVAQAEQLTREAIQRSYNERLAKMATEQRLEEKARQILAEKLRQVQDRPERVREVVKHVTDSKDCINQPVPADVIRLLN